MKKDRRYIAHIDMDAFFASIEERDSPALRGKPIVVGADPKEGKGRGVVSTCSYEARKFGIHSAMPISTAYRKCPKAVFLPVDMEKYERVSAQVYEVLYSFSPDIEPISIDEAFLDITGSHHLFGTPLETCRAIKEKIKKVTALTASVGLAPTMMAAKIASDLEKPDGLVEVRAENLQKFLWPLEIRKLWGLGKKSEEALNRIGIRTIGDIAAKDPKELIKVFGKNGLAFHRLANGIDERRVETGGEAKSISSEITFDVDTLETDAIFSALMSLCEKVSGRLRAGKLKAKTVTVKIRLDDFTTFTRAVTLESATNFIDTIYKKATALYNGLDKGGKRIRLLGVKASNFCATDFPDDLFSAASNKKTEARHNALDKIKNKYGDSAIFVARSRSRSQ